MSIDEDYYKPIIAKGTFNSSYIQCESKGDKRKNLSIKKYLNTIRPYLSDIINDHKTHGLVIYHSGTKTWLEKAPSEKKIQLTICSRKWVVEWVVKQMKLLKNFLNLFCKNIKTG